MNHSYAIAVVIIASLCTLFTRALPFLIFGRKKELSPMIRFLGNALPAAVIAILIVYCVRNTEFLVPASLLPQLISIVVVVLLHVWKRNNLLSIGVGTICYMVLVQAVF